MVSHLIPKNFAERGLTVWRNGDQPLRRLQVIGERSSGTNLVKRLMGRNSSLKPSEELGWKHGHPTAMAIPPDLAVVLVVRRADDWARSMHAKPWHATPDLQQMPFPAFLRAPWETIVDRPRYFEGMLADGALGQPLQLDRDGNGDCYANLLALRYGKMRSMLSHANRECTFALVRLESVVANPARFVDDLSAELGLTARQGDFRPVVKRLGSRFKPAIANRPETPSGLSSEDLAYLRGHIDPGIESALGYQYA